MTFVYYEKGTLRSQPFEMEVYGYTTAQDFYDMVFRVCGELKISPRTWNFIYDDDNICIQNGNCGLVSFFNDREALTYICLFVIIEKIGDLR